MAYKHVLQVDDETIFRMLQAAAKYGGLVQVHAENGDVIEVITKEALAEGHTAPKYHALTRPVELRREATRAGDLPGRSRRLAALRRARLERDGGRRDQRRAQTRPADLWRNLSAVSRLRHRATTMRPDFDRRKLRDVAAAARKWNQDVLIGKLKNIELHTFGSDHCSFNCAGKRNSASTISRRFPTARRRSRIASRSCTTRSSTAASSASISSSR